MAEVCAAAGCGVVLMHTRGRPEQWHALPAMDPRQVMPQVKQELRSGCRHALEAGIERERIVLDPGFGFGKAYDRNYSLLAGLAELSSLGQPLLAGVSRKRFLGRTLSPLYRGVDVPCRAPRKCISGSCYRSHPGWCALVRVHERAPQPGRQQPWPMQFWKQPKRRNLQSLSDQHPIWRDVAAVLFPALVLFVGSGPEIRLASKLTILHWPIRLL